jgi:chitodextrinase
LSWTASTDNVAVVRYNVYRNGTKVGSSTTTSYSDSGLALTTAYTYQISALDAAGNESAKATVLVTTGS